jgi:hypothetical protein
MMTNAELGFRRNTDSLSESAAAIAAPVFQAQGWTWGGWKSPPSVPNRSELATAIRGLLNTAETSDDTVVTVSSGRLCVTISRDEAGQRENLSVSLDLGYCP